MVAHGSHVNAMGAIVPARSELAQDIFPRCDKIVVDSIPSIRGLSTEFREYFCEDEGAWNSVQSISELVAQDAMRPANSDLTLFKAMGMGISDLALGIEVLARAAKRGNTTALPERIRIPPRLL